MYQEKSIYRYFLKEGDKIVYAGVTNDIERRTKEHKEENAQCSVVRVGDRVTQYEAVKWEHAQARQGTPIR